MLELKNIVKEYYTEDETVKALKGVSLKFRKSEFVSILGPSGCGKTTLLNIVGGLDRYTSGDLIINGKSTKDYSDSEWDTYRNHSVGFIFQSYNLIPHQTVLENVELALTLSGVSKEERRSRAVAVLEKVGLKDKIKSKPNQLSGGQMQRVAIARALINDPEILLADEPTGALDSKTSVQIMELLKEISNDRLIVMVTHNPDLAETYSSRIIKMLDGEIVEDPNPVTDSEAEEEKKILSNEKRTNKGKSKTSMSFKTALSLSLKNLLTKKARTVLVSFAGSIGIIGIALILSLSSGFQGYINKVQEDTLSNYPLTIKVKKENFSGILEEMMGSQSNRTQYPETDSIYLDQTLTNLMEAITQGGSNDLKGFKEFIETDGYDSGKISAIKYTYDMQFDVHGKSKVNNNELTKYKSILTKFMAAFAQLENGGAASEEDSDSPFADMMANMMNFNTWSEAIDNEELIKSQYDLVGGRWADFSNPNDVLLVLDSYNQIPDYALPEMGLMHEDELILSALVNMAKLNAPENVPEGVLKAEVLKRLNGLVQDVEPSDKNIKIKDLLGMDFYITLPYEKYGDDVNNDGVFNEEFNLDFISTDRRIEIVGVVRPKEGATGLALTSTLVYTKAFTDSLLRDLENAPIIVAQKANKKIDVTKGKPFPNGDEDDSGYRKNLKENFGYVDDTNLTSISLYSTTFEDKDYIVSLINKFNKNKTEQEQIAYTDYLGMMMSSITDIINAISYILIGFVSVSLIVSSIMIGIITYISVLERIKEIGILRALGASKTDVSRVFNAETLIIGFTAGILGILVTVILNIPISFVIYLLSGIHNVSTLPWLGGIILVAISMGLTLIAGLIPAKIASKKDPVVALRTE